MVGKNDARRTTRRRGSPEKPSLPTLRIAGVLLLEREVSDRVEIVVITFWHSLDSIQAFAGADLEQAVVANEAALLLTEFDRCVGHYELIIKDDIQRSRLDAHEAQQAGACHGGRALGADDSGLEVS